MKKALGLILVVLFAGRRARVRRRPDRGPKEWTIPFLNCLTGPIASYGELFEWSAERAASEINAAGGIKGKPVKIVGVDTASDPQKGSTEMARLVKDTLVALGPGARACHPGGDAHRGGKQDGVHHGLHLVRVRDEVLPLDHLLVPSDRAAAGRRWSPHGPSSTPR